MKTKIRRRIITETKQIAAILDSATPVMFSCEICGDTSKMVTPLFASKLRDISTRDIYKAIEKGETHFVELPNREFYVCLNTL
jgi:tRNA G26 N,N-dimethylase Trm1